MMKLVKLMILMKKHFKVLMIIIEQFIRKLKKQI